MGLRVTSRDGQRTTARGGGAVVVRGTKRESPGGGLVSSSSSFAAKEPVKSRLGARKGIISGDHKVGYEMTTGWADTVSTSTHSGRRATRLGGSGGTHGELATSGRKTRRTMVADSASNPPPKASSRLGAAHKSSSSSPYSSVVVSSATRAGGLPRRGEAEKTLLSMKADEYEIRRQLDIRSRLAAKEKEVEERRSGPLRGRLGQHHVFQRLT